MEPLFFKRETNIWRKRSRIHLCVGQSRVGLWYVRASQLACFILPPRHPTPGANNTKGSGIVQPFLENDGHDGKVLFFLPTSLFARVLNHQISRHVSLFFSCSAVTRYQIIKSWISAVEFQFFFPLRFFLLTSVSCWMTGKYLGREKKPRQEI